MTDHLSFLMITLRQKFGISLDVLAILSLTNPPKSDVLLRWFTVPALPATQLQVQFFFALSHSSLFADIAIVFGCSSKSPHSCCWTTFLIIIIIFLLASFIVSYSVRLARERIAFISVRTFKQVNDKWMPIKENGSNFPKFVRFAECQFIW